jgi:hypothetical protein
MHVMAAKERLSAADRDWEEVLRRLYRDAAGEDVRTALRALEKVERGDYSDQEVGMPVGKLAGFNVVGDDTTSMPAAESLTDKMGRVLALADQVARMTEELQGRLWPEPTAVQGAELVTKPTRLPEFVAEAETVLGRSIGRLERVLERL